MERPEPDTQESLLSAQVRKISRALTTLICGMATVSFDRNRVHGAFRCESMQEPEADIALSNTIDQINRAMDGLDSVEAEPGNDGVEVVMRFGRRSGSGSKDGVD